MVDTHSQGKSSSKTRHPRGRPKPARKPGDKLRPEAGGTPPIRFVSPAPPKTRKAEATRRRLLEAAAALFIERGFGAVSINDIAAEAGLTKGAIYGHFRSKGQLLVEVLACKHWEWETSRDFQETLQREPIELMSAKGQREIFLLSVDAAAAARHDPDVAAGLHELYREREQQIRAATPVSDPEIVTWIISVLARGIAMKEAIGSPMPDPRQLVSTLRTVFRSLMPESVKAESRGRGSERRSK